MIVFRDANAASRRSAFRIADIDQTEARPTGRSAGRRQNAPINRQLVFDDRLFRTGGRPSNPSLID